LKAHLGCGGIFSDSTITKFILIQTVKKFENLSPFDEFIRRTKMCQIFLTTLYIAMLVSMLMRL